MQAFTEERSSFFSPRLRPGWTIVSSSETELNNGLGFAVPVWVVVPTCVAATLVAGLSAIFWLLELRSPVNRPIPLPQYPDCGSSSDSANPPPSLRPMDSQLPSTSELTLDSSQTKTHSLASSTNQTSHEVQTLTCALEAANAEIFRLQTALQKASLTEKQTKILLSVVVDASNKKKDELKAARQRIQGLETELANLNWMPCDYSGHSDRCYVSPHRQSVRNRSPVRGHLRHTDEPRGRSPHARPLQNKSRTERQALQPLRPSQQINRPVEPITPKRRRPSIVKPRTDSGYFSMHEFTTPTRRLAFGPELTPESTPEKPVSSFIPNSPLPKSFMTTITAAINDLKEKPNTPKLPHFQRPLRRMGRI